MITLFSTGPKLTVYKYPHGYCVRSDYASISFSFSFPLIHTSRLLTGIQVKVLAIVIVHWLGKKRKNGWRREPLFYFTLLHKDHFHSQNGNSFLCAWPNLSKLTAAIAVDEHSEQVDGIKVGGDKVLVFFICFGLKKWITHTHTQIYLYENDKSVPAAGVCMLPSCWLSIQTPPTSLFENATFFLHRKK